MSYNEAFQWWLIICLILRLAYVEQIKIHVHMKFITHMAADVKEVYNAIFGTDPPDMRDSL